MSTIVFYHGDCPDGFASAFAAWLALGDSAQYCPVQHKDTLPDVTGDTVYMLDIAFDRAVMERLSEQAASLVVLDHHQTAKESLEGFRCKCGHIHFDLNHSAAYLAWTYFHPNTDIPELIQHVEDRDLLKWDIQTSPSYLGALDIGPYHFRRWKGILGMPSNKRNEFLDRGRAVYQRDKKLAEQAAAQAFPLTLLGTEGLQANVPNVLQSLAADTLIKTHPFAALWCLQDHGQVVKVGLRAQPGFDVTPIAKHFGGGGHPYASAFLLPVNRLPELLSNSLV